MDPGFPRMRILVAPDKFKGSLTAAQPAAAIGRGFSAALPDAEIRVLPIADGGEGTAEAIKDIFDEAFQIAPADMFLDEAIRNAANLLEQCAHHAAQSYARRQTIDSDG